MNVTIIIPKAHARELCPVMPCGLTPAEWDHRRDVLRYDLETLGDGVPVSVQSCTIGAQAAWLYQAHVEPESLPIVARLDLYLRDQFHLTAPVHALLGDGPLGW